MAAPKARGMGNTGKRRGLKALVWIVPSFVALGAAAGVTGPPLVNKNDLEREVAQARERADELRESRAIVEPFAAVGGFDRLAMARRLILGRTPRELPAVELHGTCRLVADRSGVVLDTIQLGGEIPSEFATLDDAVLVQQVRLGGAAELPALLRFLSGLESAGYPHAVRKVDLTRNYGNTAQFAFFVKLDLFRLGPPPQGIGFGGVVD